MRRDHLCSDYIGYNLVRKIGKTFDFSGGKNMNPKALALFFVFGTILFLMICSLLCKKDEDIQSEIRKW